MQSASLSQLLEELYLLKCSLLPGEHLQFPDPSDDARAWEACLENYALTGGDQCQPEDLGVPLPAYLSRFYIVVDDAQHWIEVHYPSNIPLSHLPTVTVRGDAMTRHHHERWQQTIEESKAELNDSEYPTYQLISSHLLPLIHAEGLTRNNIPITTDATSSSQGTSQTAVVRYHALLTSHHLISPSKRRNLQQWSGQLHVTGFAKVGYPGVIYCEGRQEQVEEFVANIKAMQWLALRVRFVEPLPDKFTPQQTEVRRWVEYEKVGEVVEAMRALGRDAFVVEMGIGSAGQK